VELDSRLRGNDEVRGIAPFLRAFAPLRDNKLKANNTRKSDLMGAHKLDENPA
jgi:hypothetical protein